MVKITLSMKLTSLRWPALMLLALGVALSSPASAQADACSRAFAMGTGHWEPYAYVDARGRFTGIDADMVRAIFREARCRLVELSPKPAIRNMQLFERGDIHLLSGASRTPEREKNARFSAPYRDETVGLFVLADDAGRFAALRSFDAVLAGPLALLAPRVGWYGKAFEQHAAQLADSGRLSRYNDYKQGVRMLSVGRASVILGDAAGLEHAAARVGVKVQPLPFWLVQAPVHLMFGRASVTSADLARIDAAIARLKRRGVFDQIRRSYGGM